MRAHSEHSVYNGLEYHLGSCVFHALQKFVMGVNIVSTVSIITQNFGKLLVVESLQFVFMGESSRAIRGQINHLQEIMGWWTVSRTLKIDENAVNGLGTIKLDHDVVGPQITM